jgi:hypothetical protein
MNEQDGLDELSAGYDDVVTPDSATKPETPPTDQPAETTPPADDSKGKEETQQEQPKAEDKPAEVPDWQKAFTEMQTQFAAQEQRLRKAEGRVGELNHTLKQTLEASKLASKGVEDAPTQAQVQDAIKTPDKWKALAEDFPEWASATEELIRENRSANVDLEPIKSGLELAQAAAARAIESATRMETMYVDRIVNAVLPNWRTEVKAPEYKEWFLKQDAATQKLGASQDPDDAATLMGKYAAHKAAKAAPAKKTPAPAQAANNSARRERFAAAVAPKGSGGFKPAKTDLDDFSAGYNS